MKVALRDDDTSYFTAPERLHAVYDAVWDRIPVCLATVPFAIGYPNPGIPEAQWHTGQSFPLEQNRALVDELKRLAADRRVTIALHGYTHQDYPNGYEFEAAPDLTARSRRPVPGELLGTNPSAAHCLSGAVSRRSAGRS
jgi:hypothetical protein